MFRRTLAVAVAAIPLTVPGAVAAAASPALTAVASVEQQARALGDATTPAKAEEQQTRLQAGVDQAFATGGASAVEELLASGNPSVAADLLKHATIKQVETDVSSVPAPGGAVIARTVVETRNGRMVSRRHRAAFHSHAAGCWGSHTTKDEVDLAGITAGWRQFTEQGWCGNGSTITWYASPAYDSYRAAIYCWNDVTHDWSWDGSTAWRHGRNKGVLGGSYVWGCASLQTIDPVVRVAANGYWDRYNDF